MAKLFESLVSPPLHPPPNRSFTLLLLAVTPVACGNLSSPGADRARNCTPKLYCRVLTTGLSEKSVFTLLKKCTTKFDWLSGVLWDGIDVFCLYLLFLLRISVFVYKLKKRTTTTTCIAHLSFSPLPRKCKLNVAGILSVFHHIVPRVPGPE